MDDTAWSDVGEVPETPPEALLPSPPAEEPPEALLPTPPHEVPLRPPDFPWPHQGVGRVDALHAETLGRAKLKTVDFRQSPDAIASEVLAALAP